MPTAQELKRVQELDAQIVAAKQEEHEAKEAHLRAEEETRMAAEKARLEEEAHKRELVLEEVHKAAEARAWAEEEAQKQEEELRVCKEEELRACKEEELRACKEEELRACEEEELRACEEEEDLAVVWDLREEGGIPRRGPRGDGSFCHCHQIPPEVRRRRREWR